MVIRSRITAILVLAVSLLNTGVVLAIEPSLPKGYTIPTIDLSDEQQRQTVVAWGTESVYQGHVNTLLMPDGKTILAAWTVNHGGYCGPMAKSTDGGLTWTDISASNKPGNLTSVVNCPTIHRLVDPSGTARLFIFAGNRPSFQAYSEDDGRTWTSMTQNGLYGVVAPMAVVPVVQGGQQKLLQWYEYGVTDFDTGVWQAESTDGGLTWRNARKIIADDGASPSEPEVIRSPNGKQLLMLMRTETGGFNSLYSTSDDEGVTWSAAKELPAALTGHRHNACYASDGRLVVTMRDMAEESPTKNNFAAWVGTYDDIINGREGQYRVKLLQNYPEGSMDCGYSGLHLLPDDTFVTTTYIKYTPGSELNSIVSVRFNLDELDARIAPEPQGCILMLTGVGMLACGFLRRNARSRLNRGCPQNRV